MKERLIDILMSVSIPIMEGQATTGVRKLSHNFAEELASALIENGVIFPTVKVGDIVWVHDFMWGVIPCEVDRPYHCRCGKEGSCTFEMDFSEKDVGTYVFSTKEEAEAVWCEKEVY